MRTRFSIPLHVRCPSPFFFLNRWSRNVINSHTAIVEDKTCHICANRHLILLTYCPVETIRWQDSRAVRFRWGACASLLVITPPLCLSCSLAQIADRFFFMWGGVSTFCLDAGGPKPRADRRAGGSVCREREFSVFSSVGTLVHFGSSVTTARVWFHCSYTVLAAFVSLSLRNSIWLTKEFSEICFCILHPYCLRILQVVSNTRVLSSELKRTSSHFNVW